MTKPTKWYVPPVWSESLLCAFLAAKDHTILHANSRDTDQTGQMPRLIRVFAGHTYHFAGFVSMWLNYYIHMYVLSVSVFRLIWYFWFQMYVAALEPNWFVYICIKSLQLELL